jgi:hypothetical protein
MNVSSIDLVDKTNNLHAFYGVNSIIEIIDHEIRKIPQYERLSRSIDLVLQICQLIENLVYDNNVKGEKGFKLDIACKIFEKLGFNKPDDKEFLIQSIKFLHSSDRIKKVRLVKKLWRFVKKFVSKSE